MDTLLFTLSFSSLFRVPQQPAVMLLMSDPMYFGWYCELIFYWKSIICFDKKLRPNAFLEWYLLICNLAYYCITEQNKYLTEFHKVLFYGNIFTPFCNWLIQLIFIQSAVSWLFHLTRLRPNHLLFKTCTHAEHTQPKHFVSRMCTALPVFVSFWDIPFVKSRTGLYAKLLLCSIELLFNSNTHLVTHLQKASI